MHKKKRFSENFVVNLMYLPALLLFIIFVVYPFITGIGISFTNWNGFSQARRFIFLENYIAIFQDGNFYTALINTLIYGVGSTFFQQILGLSYAILLNNKFRGRMVARTLIYMPVLVAAVIMGYMWYFLFQWDGGALNDIVMLFGGEPINWLNNGKLAVALMVGVNSLQFVGVSMVIYLAGLQGIPKMYYEAADIDGANKWEQFKNITVPMLAPAITTSVTLNLIGGLKLFDVIEALTEGGPGYSSHSLSTFINEMYFGNQSAGYAAGIGLILFLFILVISVSLQKYFKGKEIA